MTSHCSLPRVASTAAAMSATSGGLAYGLGTYYVLMARVLGAVGRSTAYLESCVSSVELSKETIRIVVVLLGLDEAASVSLLAAELTLEPQALG